MRKQKHPPFIPVSIEWEGKKYAGSYYVEKGMITVSGSWGQKSTQVGNSPPELLARIMLRELAQEAKARGEH
jgi:hypothetical protein